MPPWKLKRDAVLMILPRRSSPNTRRANPCESTKIELRLISRTSSPVFLAEVLGILAPG